MKLPEAIRGLIGAGLTETQIADRLGVKQPTINRIKTGEIQNPKYTLGKGILDLYDEVCAGKPKPRHRGKPEARAA